MGSCGQIPPLQITKEAELCFTHEWPFGLSETGFRGGKPDQEAFAAIDSYLSKVPSALSQLEVNSIGGSNITWGMEREFPSLLSVGDVSKFKWEA